jgi:hypothetical protein
MAAVAWWLVGRLLVGSTWADPPVVAGLRAEQVDALAVLVVLVGPVAWWTRPHRPHEPVGTTASGAGRTAA